MPISGIQELQTHLQHLLGDPSLPFNLKLLDDVELQLTEDNIPPLLPVLLPPLTGILKSTTQDPTPLLSLTIKLLSPLSFTRTLTIADPPSLLTALSSPLPGAKLLALAIIHKAAKSPSDASILSTLPDVVEMLVQSWLASADVGVGERAARVLGDLLETDCEAVDKGTNIAHSRPLINGDEVVKRSVPGHGRLWRLILSSRPSLTLIQQLCSTNSAYLGQPRSAHQVSISQGRLLRLLPRLCTLNIGALSHPVLQDVFTLPEEIGSQVGNGLLQWAALGMVDKSDTLMHLSLVDFFETFVSVMRVSRRSAEVDAFIHKLLTTALEHDSELEAALKRLPDRTVEGEAELVRAYITGILD
ncbi:uncharacterized protein MAM_03019 [Metarhizium album ARSEF 1941]|uniref:DNA mismatch repair protein HSM3 N-terminal domain-containing protein n=1 Tax=Metarhizium album (strain ARSEF 1941) TaxID=1081103 RepID=A0A0B2WTD3_METAS|nr:uncharacterized protein MAM_03019 [Metarhizium album ARSEF 1941]KHN99321.1 hypothetical protein MAM_03019 [Metarhizium album ARSEF 1941]